MNVAIYARVSTRSPQQTQTIDQQIERLQAHVVAQGWQLSEEHIFRDEGYSGSQLHRPGLDRLREAAAWGAFAQVLLTAPDRLARNYVHQVLLLEELEQQGCGVTFLERPMSNEPHDQLVLQIRGAVAEYERTLIADRMRRGRRQKVAAGQMLPWTRPPYGYILDADHPRDPTGVRLDPTEAVVVRQIFAWYTQVESPLGMFAIAQRLSTMGVPTRTGKTQWHKSTVRNILTNPLFAGTAYYNRTRKAPAQRRKSPLQPIRSDQGRRPTPPEEWVSLPVPAIVSVDQFDQVQARLAYNRQMARRHNTQHDYLLRGLISCGQCRLTCTARRVSKYFYYVCVGKTTAGANGRVERCTARYIPADRLDDLVWQDLCAVLTHPEQIRQALERAQSGQWLPQQLQARSHSLQQALKQLTRQEERLLQAYVAEVITLAELERKRGEIGQKKQALQRQHHQLDGQIKTQLEVAAMATSIDTFCQQAQQGLAQATFAQRRQLIELLIDRVVVDETQVEIRYVIPTSEAGTKTRFCHLRTDYFNLKIHVRRTIEMLRGKNK